MIQSMAGSQNELLHPPIQDFAHVELVFRRTRYLMNPSKLLELLAGFAEHAEDFSIQAELIDPSGKRIGAVQILMRRRRDTNRPGRAGRHGSGDLRRFVADGWTGVWIHWHLNHNLTLEF